MKSKKLFVSTCVALPNGEYGSNRHCPHSSVKQSRVKVRKGNQPIIDRR